MVGKWNITVDNICLSLGSELIEARPWLSVPLLSPYLHLQGQPRTLGQDFPYPTLLLYKMPLGFRWTFVAFAGTMEAVGCWTMQCSESMGEKKGGNPHIMLCKGPSVTFASQQIWLSAWWEKKKHLKNSQSSTKLNKHNGPRKKIFHEPTPDVIELNLFIYFFCSKKIKNKKSVWVVKCRACSRRT